MTKTFLDYHNAFKEKVQLEQSSGNMNDIYTQLESVIELPENVSFTDIEPHILEHYPGDFESETIDNDITNWVNGLTIEKVSEILTYVDEEGEKHQIGMGDHFPEEVRDTAKRDILIMFTITAVSMHSVSSYKDKLTELSSGFDDEYKKILMSPIIDRREHLQYLVNHADEIGMTEKQLYSVKNVINTMTRAPFLDNTSFRNYFSSNRNIRLAHVHARNNDSRLEEKALKNLRAFKEDSKLSINPRLWEIENIIVEDILMYNSHPIMEFAGLARAMVVVFCAHRKDFTFEDYNFIAQVISDLLLLLQSNKGETYVEPTLKKITKQYVTSFAEYYQRISSNEITLDFSLYDGDVDADTLRRKSDERFAAMLGEHIK